MKKLLWVLILLLLVPGLGVTVKGATLSLIHI